MDVAGALGDAVASPVLLSSAVSGQQTLSLTYASTEVGEPFMPRDWFVIENQLMHSSVWAKWVAPAAGTLRLQQSSPSTSCSFTTGLYVLTATGGITFAKLKPVQVRVDRVAPVASPAARYMARDCPLAN